MANASSGSEEAGKPGRVKLPIPLLLVVVILGVWLGLAGGGAAVFFLAKSGKLPMVAAASKGPTSAADAGRQMVLEPILVNLADEGGHAYLRVGLTLDVSGEGAIATAEAGAAKGKGSPENAVRDIVLTVLGRQTSALLLGPDGKEHLKIELKEAITKSNLKVDVKDLYFSDFLVQS
jgi:flagellar FliL protein